MPTYTYASLKTAINGRLHNKIGLLADPRTTINNAVKEVYALMDLRSSKRRVAMAPNLFQDIFSYSCPPDMKGYGIIDLQRQTDDRPKSEGFDLVGEEQFDQRKSLHEGLVAFSDRDFTRKLLISGIVDDQNLIITSLDSITAGGGTWTAVGDGTNIRTDSQNYVKGNGSVEFDMNSGGTTAGIENTALSVFDLTNYLANGSIFVRTYIVTADSNLTGATIKLGSSSSNYYTRTVTTTHEGLAFQQGWNLLRFDLNGISQVGTVVNNDCTYAALYFNKLAGKPSETSYRFDHIMAKNGRFYNVIYYSSYPWQTAAGAYIENSTADTDYINCDSTEYNLMIEKGVELAGPEAREYTDADRAATKFNKVLKVDYEANYPSESATWTESYHDFATIDGDFRQFGGER